MRGLNLAEIKSVSGGTYFVATASKIQSTTLLASYAQSINYNQQIASMSIVSDYILNNSESS
ncbi:MAG: hypothetical protein ACI95C_002697 [Pseudohongiellaceae bacterium]|jgi:hypothetical protein